MSSETKQHLVIAEAEMSIDRLSQVLNDAFYDISNLSENSIDVVINEYRATLKLLEDKKSIYIRCIDRIGDYDAALYQRLL